MERRRGQTELLLREEIASRTSGIVGQVSWQTKQQELELLQAEQARVNELEKSLQQSQQLTDSMVGILGSFEERLSRLDESMAPIHDRTNKLKLLHTNIEETLGEMQRVLNIYDTSTRVQPIIIEGLPRQVLLPVINGEKVGRFVKALQEIKDATVFLQVHSNFKGAETALGRLQSLRKLAVSHCERALSELFNEHSDALDVLETLQPDKLQAILLAEETFELWPEVLLSHTKTMVKELQGLKHLGYQKVYMETRRRFLTKTLQKLSPDQIAYGKSDKSLDLTKGSVVAGQGLIPVAETRDYVKGTHKYLYFIKVVVVLIKAERKLAQELVSKNHFDSVFSDIIEEALDLLIETGESIIKIQMNADKLFGAFVLFDIWENLSSILPVFQQTIKVSGSHLGEELKDFASKLSTTLRHSFTAVEEDIAQEDAKQVPADGTVSELVSNIMNYLKRLFEYKEIVESLLPGQSVTGVASGVTPLGAFIMRIIRALLVNLQEKAEKAKKKAPALANVFLLNNAHYMMVSVCNTELLGILDSRFVRNIQDTISDERATYKESWSKALQFITDDPEDDKEYAAVAAKKKLLSSKLKKKLKAKFSGFNSEVEELVDAQKRYTIHDPELCDHLRNDIKSFILPAYKTFLQRHDPATFTTKSGKYIKYAPDTLETMITNFFEGQTSFSSKKSKKK